MNPLERACWVVLCFALAACAGKHRAIVGPTGDYADYRATRVARSVPERLKAASNYLDRHPRGVFHDEVEEWFGRIEPLFFEATADSLAGVQTYLDALPNGPHAAQAEERRDAFRAAAKVEAGQRLSEKGAEFERRLAAAAQAREDVLTTYASWLGGLLDWNGWGRPLDQSQGEFASRWFSDPKPKCGPDRCTKLLLLSYELEVQGKPQKLVCVIEISLRLTQGRVVEAEVAGPDLFTRLAEAHFARPAQGDGPNPSRALAWVVELTAGATERRFPGHRCARQGTERALLVRECDGWRLDLIPKSQSAPEDDRVVIRGRSEL